MISPAGATGFWQIMKGTAREYGLEVNYAIDERYHLIKSTEAACKYLQKAYDKFGSWTMAAASYNMGINGVQRQVKKQNTNNYFNLYLNDETSRYVFRIIVIKEIMENPRKYGFVFRQNDLYYYPSVKQIRVDSTINNLYSFAQENDINYIHEIWPSLELYLHGGMNIAPYKKNFQSISTKKINFYQNYNATEGFFGLQSENDADDMLLMLDYGIYYEFISKDNWEEDQPLTLSLEDVELNTPYEVVISTNGGLWRYRLEDTVIFTSINPFKIKVIGRTKQFINIAGEELMIQHVETAINLSLIHI